MGSGQSSIKISHNSKNKCHFPKSHDTYEVESRCAAKEVLDWVLCMAAHLKKMTVTTCKTCGAIKKIKLPKLILNMEQIRQISKAFGRIDEKFNKKEKANRN